MFIVGLLSACLGRNRSLDDRSMKFGTKSVYMMFFQEIMLAKKNPRWPPKSKMAARPIYISTCTLIM